MEPLARLDSKSILSEEIFLEVFDQEDEITKARMILSLTDRAGELGVKKKFEELLKAIKGWTKKRNKESARSQSQCWISGQTLKDPYNNNVLRVHGLPVRMASMHRMTARWMRLPVITPFFR